MPRVHGANTPASPHAKPFAAPPFITGAPLLVEKRRSGV